jgi:hypothetical protein
MKRVEIIHELKLEDMIEQKPLPPYLVNHWRQIKKDFFSFLVLLRGLSVLKIRLIGRKKQARQHNKYRETKKVFIPKPKNS